VHRLSGDMRDTSCPEVINHDVTLITTRKINDLHDITITTIFNLWISSNFSISLFFQIYISCSIRPIHRHFSLVALRVAPFKNLFKTFYQNTSEIAGKFIFNVSKTSLLFPGISGCKREAASRRNMFALSFIAPARVCCAGISSRKIFVHLWVRQKKKKGQRKKRGTQNGERAAKAARENVWPRNGYASVLYFPR